MKIDQAMAAAKEAYEAYSKLPLNKRQQIIDNIKSNLLQVVPEIATKIVEETGMGKAQDKIVKLLLAIQKTPGVEDLVTEAQTGDDGLTLYELSSYGIVCTSLPCTNPCETLINNTISLLAAGNAVIHIPHPRAVNVSKYVTDIIDRAIYYASGIEHLVITLEDSSMQQASELMNHPDVNLIVITGNGRMARHFLGCEKRVICAGPANPVAIVDETADIAKAAKDIVMGASFDNNIMCITEKNIVVVEEIADLFIEGLEYHHAHVIQNEEDMLKLTAAVLTEDMTMNLALKGKSAPEILKAAGIPASTDVDLIVVDTVKIHPFVTLELMMPVVPMIRVKDFDAALDTALMIEQGYRHTAVIHSQSIEHLDRAACVMKTSIFVKNASSLAGIGVGGEGATSFTIATITGEGSTTARTFARKRRCCMANGFSIR
ncbi:MAG: aldehyde dehydrogenase [Clostridiales Family XIII bacterium]|jgi:propionaldehyde dehydrogenase|nr:aldehyde dehydrogenase [Clostridiales Family XIII bacterium]